MWMDCYRINNSHLLDDDTYSKGLDGQCCCRSELQLPPEQRPLYLLIHCWRLSRVNHSVELAYVRRSHLHEPIFELGPVLWHSIRPLHVVESVFAWFCSADFETKSSLVFQSIEDFSRDPIVPVPTNSVAERNVAPIQTPGHG